MNKHRVLNWTLAGVAALALSTSYMLDATTPKQAEWTQAKELEVIQKTQATEARAERAAAQLCAKTHVPGAYRWSEDGTLVCSTAHNGRVSVAARGGV